MEIKDQSTARMGGFAGILGSALLLGVFAFLAVFVGLDTLDAQAALSGIQTFAGPGLSRTRPIFLRWHFGRCIR